MQKFKKITAVFFALCLLSVFAANAHAKFFFEKKSQTSKISKKEIWSGNRAQGLSPEANARAHWEKHGREFPEYKTADQYIAAANAFVTNPPQDTLHKFQADGDNIFYNPKNNIFAVATPRGIPRTMFRPKRGKAYYDAQ